MDWPSDAAKNAALWAQINREHTDDSAFAQKAHATQQLIASIEKCDPRARSRCPQVAINEKICQALVKRAETVLRKFFSEMAVKFPIADVTNERDPA